MGDFLLVHLCPCRSVRPGCGFGVSDFFIRLRAIYLGILNAFNFLLNPCLALHRCQIPRLHVVAQFAMLCSYGIESMRRYPRRTKPELWYGGSELPLTRTCITYKFPLRWIGIVSPVLVSSKCPPYRSKWFLKPRSAARLSDKSGRCMSATWKCIIIEVPAPSQNISQCRSPRLAPPKKKKTISGCCLVHGEAFDGRTGMPIDCRMHFFVRPAGEKQ